MRKAIYRSDTRLQSNWLQIHWLKHYEKLWVRKARKKLRRWQHQKRKQ
jgi:hypothetical protein